MMETNGEIENEEEIPEIDSYPLIKVVWADHWVDQGDFDLDDIKEKAKPYYGEYAGYLVVENKQMLVLCSNIWENGQQSDPMYIMKRCIVSRSDR